MKKITIVLLIVSSMPLCAAESKVDRILREEQSPLGRMLSSAARPAFKPARVAGVSAEQSTSDFTPEEIQAIFTEQELPPSQELLDLGAKLYAQLQRSEKKYDKANARTLYTQFKDMGGRIEIRDDALAKRRLNELRRERLKHLSKLREENIRKRK